MLAGLAETGTTLADGTQLFVGLIAFAAQGPAFALPPDDGNSPDFAALAGKYADVLVGPPPTKPSSGPMGRPLSSALTRVSIPCHDRGR